MKLSDGLLALMLACEKSDTRITLEYDTGRYVPGELLDLENMDKEPDPSSIRQGPKGWKVEISGYYCQDNDGNQALYPDLESAVVKGMMLLESVLEDR